jgi:phosphatidylglycerophosphatase A
VKPSLARAIATVGGLGALPRFGGPVASALGLALVVGADRMAGPWFAALIAIAAAVLGVWTCEQALRAAAAGLIEAEPKRLVVRDLAGQMLVGAATPINPAGVLLAFGAYQLFLHARPWPTLESLVPVPRGVAAMADGAFAALGAALTIGFMTWTLGSV